MKTPTHRTTRSVLTLLLLLAMARVASATPPPPATSLNTCQAQVKTAAKTYADGYLNAVASCLQAVSMQVIQKNLPDASKAAATCVSQFRAISDSRGAGKSLKEKLTTAIDKKCSPGFTANQTHVLPDILGPGAGVLQPIETENLNEWCTHFGGDGTIDTLQEWTDCAAASHVCAAQQAIVTQYPRALEWLAEVRTSMAALTAPATDVTKISDALAGLDAVVAAIDGPDNDGKPSLQCGRPTTLLATGQTTAYGTGSDADVNKGARRSYTDNGDGTVTDNTTGLMWEKKDQAGGIHDWGNTYTWSGASYGGTNVMDGTITTTFLAALNAGAGFAGHSDWRIPNQNELLSLVDYENVNPAVDGAFNSSCAASCTVLTCSCTSSTYWSATTYQGGPVTAWIVGFYDGAGYVYKGSDGYVRAVRGGS